jgi:hypothetical protein
MPRRTRANSGKQTIPPAGPVTVRRVQPAKPTKKSTPAKPAEPTYTEDEARDLLCQGYSPERVALRTGYSLAWVRKQRVPAKSLLDQAREKAASPQ